jgi:hypothetical protein
VCAGLLLAWQRSAELSCDCAAILVAQVSGPIPIQIFKSHANSSNILNDIVVQVIEGGPFQFKI